jgi:hypothetical protein
MDVLGPDVNDTSTVASQHELTLEPFILNTFVKNTRQDVIIRGFTNWLINQHISIQRVHGDTVATADDDVPCYVVDSSALKSVNEKRIPTTIIVGSTYINYAIGRKSPDEASAVQIP